MSRLKQKYQDSIKQQMMEQYQYSNKMMIPRVAKVVISMGLAEASKDKTALQDAIAELKMLSGQKPLVTKSRVAVASFKLRKGVPIGAKVTLRGKRMYDFMDRLFHIVTPRIRDFRGFPLKGDGRGNYSLGLDDQQIFPEINLDKVKRAQGMRITFVTTAATDDECLALLGHLGLPFVRED